MENPIKLPWDEIADGSSHLDPNVSLICSTMVTLGILALIGWVFWLNPLGWVALFAWILRWTFIASAAVLIVVLYGALTS